MKPKRQKRIFTTLHAFIFLVCIMAADFAFFHTVPLNYLYPFTFDQPSGPQQAAAILFNDFSPDFKGINNETRRRVHQGFSLMKNDVVELLIVVGGNRKESDRKGAQLMADHLLELGVPADKILVEASSNDTITNMKKLGKILTEKKIDTLALVSSPYHLLRLQNMHIQSEVEFNYHPYMPADCTPPLSRNEIWFSAHYNALAYAAHTILPKSAYRKLVTLIREQTDW